MRYPDFLQKKEPIYLVAPSFGCTFDPYSTRLEKAIELLKKDYEIISGQNIYTYHATASNTKEARAKEINTAFASKAKVVYSVGGGEIMTDILEKVDFELLKQNPKWFVGFSDNTNLTFLYTIICDVASLYAINFPTFALNKPHQSIIDTLRLLKGELKVVKGYSKYQSIDFVTDNPLESYTLNRKKTIKVYDDDCLSEVNKKYVFKGRLLGGCLDILEMLIGTDFDKVNAFIEKYKNDKIIWYLEACDLDPIAIYRSLLHLKRAKWFQNVEAIIFGRPLKAFEVTVIDMDEYSAAIRALKDLKIKMFFDLDFGHVPPNMPIVNGALCEVEIFQNISMSYAFDE